MGINSIAITISVYKLILAYHIQLKTKSTKNFPTRLKMNLNAYSFNYPLFSGELNLDQLPEFCAANKFDAVDLTINK